MYMGSIRRYTKDDGVSKMLETWQNGKAVRIGSKHQFFWVLTPCLHHENPYFGFPGELNPLLAGHGTHVRMSRDGGS